jgi:hypothetical protein
VNGDYIHIIQTESSVNGKLEPFESILDAKIVMSPETQLCNDTMRDFLFQIAVVRGATVVEGMIGADALLLHHCTISGTNLTAREVLLQTLRQMGDNDLENPPTRFECPRRAQARSKRILPSASWSILQHYKRPTLYLL